VPTADDPPDERPLFPDRRAAPAPNGDARVGPSAPHAAAAVRSHVGKHFHIGGRLGRVRADTAEAVCFEDVATGEPWQMARAAFEAWARAERVWLGDAPNRAPPLRRFRDARAAEGA
jgi:hypothetical protein